MTIRSRPVLDRKHRPRWRDELRTQQLTILGFALAIALAIGIFGAASWNGYWEAHFRPVAAVAGEAFDRSDLAGRERILTAEAVATVRDLESQLDGGPGDQFITQQIEGVTSAFNQLPANATESLVQGAVLDQRAAEYGVSVSDEAVSASIAERMGVPERVRAQLILVDPLPNDAAPDDEPTAEQLDEARAAAQDTLERLEGGEEFADVAVEVSDDFSASAGGALGWIAADDPGSEEYFEALADAEVGDFVGPVDTERGIAVLELLDRREATAEGPLAGLLDEGGVPEASYREFVRSELLVEAYREHFVGEVVGTEPAQQRVARIGITPPPAAEDAPAEPVPQERARHVLIAPLPDAEDQAEATDEQWEAARAEAEEVRGLLGEPEADWYAIAEERSDDPGSGASGGDLGWYDPENPGFVPEFTATLATLEIGEISEPVRTDFGWHVIQKTGERESPTAQAEELIATLDGDTAAFAEAARRISDDRGTAADGGELGWIVPYQLEPMQDEAVFALSEVGDVSEPVTDDTGTITIYQLLETSDGREIDDAQLGAIEGAGFDRWLAEEVRAPVETWLDPLFQPAPAP